MTSEAVREKEATSNCCWRCITRLTRCLACCCHCLKVFWDCIKLFPVDSISSYSDIEERSRDFELEETGNIDDLTGTASDIPLESAPDSSPGWPEGETPQLIAAPTKHQSSENLM